MLNERHSKRAFNSSFRIQLLEVLVMRFRNVVLVIMSSALALGWLPSAAAQQSQLSPTQRLDVMRSRLDTLHRTLNSAIAGLNAKDTGAGQEQSADDPRTRLGGPEKK